MQPNVQVNIAVQNQPSALARVCDKLRASQINITAITCSEGRDTSVIHMVVDDHETAKIILKELGPVSTTPVLGFKVKNEPGALALLGRACAAAGVNIRNMYSTMLGREGLVYVSVDDIDKAMSALKTWEKTVGKVG